jgi:hypothetical protein
VKFEEMETLLDPRKNDQLRDWLNRAAQYGQGATATFDGRHVCQQFKAIRPGKLLRP